DKLEDALEKNYPESLLDEDKVERVDLDSIQLTQIVMYLACLSNASGGDFVPSSATTLFASKRYGRAAFHVLERESKGRRRDAKDAKFFLWQMRQYLKPRTE